MPSKRGAEAARTAAGGRKRRQGYGVTLPKARQPFRFYTRLTLKELTGLRVITLTQLLKLIRTVPGSSIYHHTHHYLQQHQYLTPEPPNDFAYWVAEVLGDKALGERLVSIDTVEFSTLRSLREKLAETIEDHLRSHPLIRLRFVSVGEAFHFVKAVSVVLPTPYEAKDLQEFADGLQAVTIDSLYFHVFEARLRLERNTNDFSAWLKNSLSEEKLAKAIEFLDPYTRTMEELRQTILRLVLSRILELEKP